MARPRSLYDQQPSLRRQQTYTLHPTPYTLHPTPYTLHPTPYTPAVTQTPENVHTPPCIITTTTREESRDISPHPPAGSPRRVRVTRAGRSRHPRPRKAGAPSLKSRTARAACWLAFWEGCPIPPGMIGLHSGPSNPLLRLRRSLHPHTSSGSIPRSQAEWGHGPVIVLVMARVRQNGESSLINSVISNQLPPQ